MVLESSSDLQGTQFPGSKMERWGLMISEVLSIPNFLRKTNLVKSDTKYQIKVWACFFSSFLSIMCLLQMLEKKHNLFLSPLMIKADKQKPGICNVKHLRCLVIFRPYLLTSSHSFQSLTHLYTHSSRTIRFSKSPFGRETHWWSAPKSKLNSSPMLLSVTLAGRKVILFPVQKYYIQRCHWLVDWTTPMLFSP